MRFRDGSDKRNSIKFCANLVKSATETLAMIGQAIGEEGEERYKENPNSPRSNKGETGEEQSQEHAPHFL
jgi:hypothetical protein